MAFDRVYLEILILSSKNHPESKSLMIKSQPYVGEDFSEMSSTFMASNRFALKSIDCIEIVSETVLYVRGSYDYKNCRIERINNNVNASALIANLKIAVREYNIDLDRRYDIMEAESGLVISHLPDYSYESPIVPNRNIVRIIL